MLLFLPKLQTFKRLISTTAPVSEGPNVHIRESEAGSQAHAVKGRSGTSVEQAQTCARRVGSRLRIPGSYRAKLGVWGLGKPFGRIVGDQRIACDTKST